MAMRSCACPTCPNTSRPGQPGSTPLNWFPLPKPGFLRDMWFDALAIKDSDVNEGSRVCSAHFKRNDILKGHKQLKADAVPTLHLGKKGDWLTAINNSDIELSDDEIKVVEEKKKPIPELTIQTTPEGRPSRRAARAAAEKIQKTVQKYCMEEEESPPHRPDFKYISDVKPSTSGAYSVGVPQKKAIPTVIAPKQLQIIQSNTQLANQAIKKGLPAGTTLTIHNPIRPNPSGHISTYSNKIAIPANPKMASIPPTKIMIPTGKNQTITYTVKPNQLNQGLTQAPQPKPKQIQVTTQQVVYKPVQQPAKPMVVTMPQIPPPPKLLPLKDRTDIMNLQMECEDSPLSAAQVKAYHNAVKLNEVFEKKLLSYKNGKDTRIIYCTTGKVPTINTSPIMTNASSSLQELSRSVNSALKRTYSPNIIRAPVSVNNQVRAPMQLQPGMMLAQTAQGMQLIRGVVPPQTLVLGNTTNTMTGSANTLSYKVLVDSRTGLVVGTIPNDSPLLQQNKNITLNTTQTTPVSISLHSQTKTVQSTTNASSGLQITSVTGAKNTTNNPQQDVFNKVIAGGTKTVVAQSLLSIRVLPIPENTKKARNLQITQLGQQLDRDKFLSAPIQWLAKVGLIDKEIKCLCMKDKMELSICKLSVDGYLWRCKRAPKCQRTVQIPRISFFSRFGAQLYKLHRLIFHWSIQSDILHVIHDTVVDIYMVRSVWRAVQEVCGKALETKASKLGGPISKVEVVTIKMGWHIIVGAYDRTTKRCRMKVITNPKNEPLGLSQTIYRLVDQWVASHTVVLTTDYKLSTMSKSTLTFKYVDVTKTYSQDMSVKLGVENLETQLTRMFGSFSTSQLKPETIQGFLDEYQWRTRFGSSPRMAFWNIISDIAAQSGRRLIIPNELAMSSASSSSSEDGVNEDNAQSVFHVASSSSGTGTWVKKTQPVQKPAVPVTEPPKIVDLNNYYYARKNPDTHMLIFDSNLNNYHFKCLVCRKILDNNVKVMKHIMAHLEQTRQRNPDLSDLTQCKYCFRDFDTPYSMQCHMENVHLSTNDLACKICNHALSSKTSLINHMKHQHVQSEIPYGCQACNYRSSFHREVIDHFQQVHNGTNKLLCHYCLKTYTIKFSQPDAVGMIQNYYYHLYKHQIKSANKKCSSCCLVFVNILELKTHKQKDHVSMAKKKDVVPLPINTSNPILVPDPHKKPLNKSPNQGAVKKTSAKQTPPVLEPYGGLNQSMTRSIPSSSQDTAVILDNLEGIHTCAECRQQIERNHYAKKMICGKCHYSTYCGKAFVDHMIAQHSNVMKPKRDMNFISDSLKLNNPLFCICGFSNNDGNILANHLKKCGYKTAYPSPVAALAATVKKEPEEKPCESGSAFFPPLVVLDENEEAFVNSTLSKIPEPQAKRPKLEQIKPGNEKKPTIQRESANKAPDTKKPSMFDALGLVRRKSNVSEEDDDEDAPPVLTREVEETKEKPKTEETEESKATSSSLTKEENDEINKILEDLGAFGEQKDQLKMDEN